MRVKLMDRAERRFAANSLVGTLEKVTIEQILNDKTEETSVRVHDAVMTALEQIGIPVEIARAAQALMRSQGIQSAIKQRLDAEVATLVQAEMAKRADELEERVRTLVAERFEEAVSATARKLLEDELEKVRRRFT